MEDTQDRIGVLIESITHTTFLHASQALFEKDKLTFLAQMTFQVRPSLEASLKPQADTCLLCILLLPKGNRNTLSETFHDQELERVMAFAYGALVWVTDHHCPKKHQ